jgi:hypothetical protein
LPTVRFDARPRAIIWLGEKYEKVEKRNPHQLGHKSMGKEKRVEDKRLRYISVYVIYVSNGSVYTSIKQKQ